MLGESANLLLTGPGWDDSRLHVVQPTVPAAVLDDGLLDVSYIMNYPGEQVPTLLRELMRGREESDTLEIMDCFGSMRVKWLEVHCADGLQAKLLWCMCPCVKVMHLPNVHMMRMACVCVSCCYSCLAYVWRRPMLPCVKR